MHDSGKKDFSNFFKRSYIITTKKSKSNLVLRDILVSFTYFNYFYLDSIPNLWMILTFAVDH